MLNRIFLLMLLCMPSIAYAENGKFSYVNKGQRAPFKGTIFDDKATAHLLTLPDFYQTQCDLDLEYQLGRTTEKYLFQIKDLKSEIVFIQEERDITVKQKDTRIEDLEKQLKKKSRSYEPYIFAGGILVGIGVTVGIIRGVDSLND